MDEVTVFIKISCGIYCSISGKEYFSIVAYHPTMIEYICENLLCNFRKIFFIEKLENKKKTDSVNMNFKTVRVK